MNCEKYKELIEKDVDGVLGDKESAELKTHIENCPGCRGEFLDWLKMRSAVAESLLTQTDAVTAKDAVLSKISSRKMRVISAQKSWPYKWMAAAAAVLVVAGFFAGFGMGKNASSIKGTRVPLAISKIEGIVLVKHRGTNIWQELDAESGVYLGDTFHCAAKSNFALVFADKSTMEVSQNSMLELKSYNGQTEFYLTTGVLAADLISPHEPFFISTPNGRVEALGTTFKVSVE